MQTTSSHPIKHEIKETISLSLPLIGSWLIYSLSGFIGTAMVAHLGDDALAASILVQTMWMSVMVFFFGVFTSISVLVSHQYGARNYQAIGEIMSQAFMLGALMCIPIATSLLLFPTLLSYTKQSPEVLALALKYTHSLVWSVPGMLFLVILEHFLNGIGRTKLSLMISLIEVPIEIALIYLFVFGGFGIPSFGIAGVGYGFAASYTLTLIVLLLYLQRARFIKPFQLFKSLGQVHLGYCKELFAVGLPVGVMYVIEVTAFSAATFLMAHFNTTILAAHQIIMQYLGLTINVAFAIAQAVSIRIGHNVGQKNEIGVRYAAYVGIAVSTLGMAFMSFLYLCFPRFLLLIDINSYDPANAVLVQATISLFALLSIFQLAEGVRIVESGALRGLKDTRFSMYASFIAFWLVGISSAYLLSFHFAWQGKGIWAGLSVGAIVGAFILFVRLKNKLRSINFDLLLSEH